MASSQAAGRIDVHHHLCPPDYIAAVVLNRPLQAVMREWTPARSLADMDRAGVARAILSITTPGLWFGDVGAARRLARACNEYAAGLVAAHPGRFGFFAAMPLPDVEGSLAEAAYALDTLKADGIGLFTSYGGKYLGDAAFAPLFAELDRRRALVYTHPTATACCVNLVPEVTEATIEYGTDTTRTIASLVFSGAAARWRGLDIIFSHAGGTMPFLIERFIAMAKSPQLKAALPEGVLHELRRFHYDIAQAANPAAMAGLRHVVEVSQILFGTDYPYRSAAEHVRGLAECGFTADELRAIDRDNAERLLARRR